MAITKTSINIPIFRQKPDSVECGIVCMQMIYAYYNNPITFESLKQDLPTTKIGTYLPQLGSHFQKNGLKTELITFNPKLFHSQDVNLPQSVIPDHFQQLQSKAENENDKMVLEFFTDYLGNGGKIIPQIPSPEIIQKSLDQKYPIMVVLNATPLHRNNNKISWKDAFHIVVINGIDNHSIYLNDPIWTKNGGKTKHSLENFFFSLFCSSLTDPDNGSLLIVKNDN